MMNNPYLTYNPYADLDLGGAQYYNPQADHLSGMSAQRQADAARAGESAELE